MKLLIPQIGEPEDADRRLMHLAEFLGIECEPLSLEKQPGNPLQQIEAIPDAHAKCLILNPEVIRKWVGSTLPRYLVRSLTGRFPFLFVHALRPDFGAALARAISCGSVESILPIKDHGANYEIDAYARGVCGAFAGITFGPAHRTNDAIFAPGVALRTLISIAGQPFMATMKQGNSEILFLASANVVDVYQQPADRSLHTYFSQFVPHAMALRHIFGEQSWHPSKAYASLMIDDPLLRPRYGYVDYEALLRLMKEHNFATTIAFIPHNFRRNRKQTVRLFQESGDRLSMCFHGNDHTAAEFASANICWLNTTVRVADVRMNRHTRSSGLPCKRVMVFPQEMFSVEAMKVLQAHSFYCAVNAGPNPAGTRSTLVLAEVAQPALLRFGGFPLFLRKYVREVKREELAFNLFFGRPALLVEHHGIFKNPDALIDTVAMINSLEPKIRWCGLATAVVRSNLRRTGPEGSIHVRPYSSTIHLANDSRSTMQFRAEWHHPDDSAAVERVVQDGISPCSYHLADSTIQLSVELGPSESHEYSVLYRNSYPSVNGLGLPWGVKAFTRRRLSEIRDNYVSKSPLATAVGEAMRRVMLSRVL